jgi:hypothetical protein
MRAPRPATRPMHLFRRLNLTAPDGNIFQSAHPLPISATLLGLFRCSEVLRSSTITCIWTSGFAEDVTSTSAFERAPLPRVVSLAVYPVKHAFMLPWSRLTVLSIRCIHPTSCAKSLNGATNLVFCKFGLDSYVQLTRKRQVTISNPLLCTPAKLCKA